MFQYRYLSRHAGVFQHLTGLRLGDFEALAEEMVPLQKAAQRQKLAKGLGATPRRKPRGQERCEEDKAFNRAFARRRIQVEHSIGRVRRYDSLSQMDRHHRKNHTERVVAVAGLANRQIQARHPYLFA